MRMVLILSIMTTVFFFSSCSERKDNTLNNAILQFALLCPGGTASACVAQTCTSQFPDVTTENFTAVSNCTSNCTNNCNLQNIYLLIEAQ